MSHSFDIFVPEAQSNPYWVGGVQPFVTIPGAGIYNQPLQPHTELTPLNRGEWSTLDFDVPREIREAMLGDFGNAQFHIALNYGSCETPVLLDNLRFTGVLTDREEFHRLGSVDLDISTNTLFGFEDAADWSASHEIWTEMDLVVEGAAALAVDAEGWTEVTSREFSTSELSDVTRRLNLDVFLPGPQANRYWFGEVHLAMVCGETYYWIGMAPMTNLFEEAYNSLEFHIDESVFELLSGANNQDETCQVKVQINAAPGDGVFRLDNLGFINN